MLGSVVFAFARTTRLLFGVSGVSEKVIVEAHRVPFALARAAAAPAAALRYFVE